MLPPIWVRNPKTKKYELFPYDELEEFEDGLQGLDNQLWLVPNYRGYEIFNKFRWLFLKQYKSQYQHHSWRYVFLPTLPWHKRWRLRINNVIHIILATVPTVLWFTLTMLMFVLFSSIIVAGSWTILSYLVRM